MGTQHRAFSGGKAALTLLSPAPPADEGLWDTFVKDIPRSTTSYTISLDKLRQGVTYEFRVVAVNQVGYGEPSSPSTAVSGRKPFQKPQGENFSFKGREDDREQP